MARAGLGFRVLTSSLFFLLSGGLAYQGYQVYSSIVLEKKALQDIIRRLDADSRIAEAVVTEARIDPVTQKPVTTIKFLEYAWDGRTLAPKYFTFNGDIIQFQSLVVRFDDVLVKKDDPLRGKSVYLFWKAFHLDGKNTQEYVITPVNEVPDGYRIEVSRNPFEERIWRGFWSYALDPRWAAHAGIKNAQVEAPGTKFVPGMLYTLKIEHDGGIRIDTARIPAVLRGETIQ